MQVRSLGHISDFVSMYVSKSGAKVIKTFDIRKKIAENLAKRANFVQNYCPSLYKVLRLLFVDSLSSPSLYFQGLPHVSLPAI